ncbi:MAG: sialidase family protein [Clostridiaceae bacterium]|nr:sialidase family protein [Clostridiaceae bacterium]
MKCYSGWSYHPYAPLTEKTENPVIVRLAPLEDGIRFEFIDRKPASEYTAVINLFETETRQTISISSFQSEVHGLESNAEYELTIRTRDGRASLPRRFRTGFVPGVVVNYLHPEDPAYAFSGRYLCSPSVVRLPSGALLCSMDLFGHTTPQNLELLFRSDDDGETWHYVTDIMPCFWGRLFVHREKLYMLGISNEYGDVLIGRSDDEGVTWGTPTVLLRGSACTSERGCHRAPMRILPYRGRLWTALEYGAWNKKRFSAGALSAAEDADLLDVNAWSVTDFAEIDPAWLGLPGGEFCAAIEGNMVEGPDGGLYSLMRCRAGQALLLRYDADNPDAAPVYVRTVDFPMAHSKFEVLRNPDGVYLAVGNRLPLRNILSVYTSRDLISWEFVRDIENRETMDEKKTAFQYPTAFLENNTLYVVSRTAYNGAASFHDSNFTTFYRVEL